MIDIRYSCHLCGLEKVHCDVPEREEGTDVVAWVKMASARLSEDYARRSPDCHPESLSDVLIPVSGAKYIGGPAVQ